MALTRSRRVIKLKVIASNNSNERSHVCGICSMAFQFKKDLKDHIRFHPAAKPFACKNCGKRFVTNKQLELHLRFVHGPKVFVCEKGCKKAFARESDLKDHSIFHETNKPYCCEECGKCFKTERFLKTHFNVHSTEATFVPASEIMGNRRKETCDSESDDAEHITQKKIRVFTCDICNKHFQRGFNFRRHRASHSKKIFPCVKCEPKVQFYDIISREKHYAICHSGKPFECFVCQRVFRTKGNMDRHVLLHVDKSSLIEKK